MTLTPLEEEVRADTLERIAMLERWRVGIENELADLHSLLSKLEP